MLRNFHEIVQQHADQTNHPVPGRQGQPRRQGRQLPEPARRRRPGRAGRPLQRHRAPTSWSSWTSPRRSARARPSSTWSSAWRRTSSSPSRSAAASARVEQIDELLRSGAEKASVNTAAVQNPESDLAEAAKRFGNQCVVLAIDARRSKTRPGHWQVCVKAGSEPTDIDVVEWAKRGEQLGAGEILLTSMDADGTKAGYDNAA